MKNLRLWEITCWLFFAVISLVAGYLIAIGQLTGAMWQFYIFAICNALTFILGYALHTASTEEGRKLLEKYKK